MGNLSSIPSGAFARKLWSFCTIVRMNKTYLILELSPTGVINTPHQGNKKFCCLPWLISTDSVIASSLDYFSSNRTENGLAFLGRVKLRWLFNRHEFLGVAFLQRRHNFPFSYPFWNEKITLIRKTQVLLFECRDCRRALRRE